MFELDVEKDRWIGLKVLGFMVVILLIVTGLTTTLSGCEGEAPDSLCGDTEGVPLKEVLETIYGGDVLVRDLEIRGQMERVFTRVDSIEVNPIADPPTKIEVYHGADGPIPPDEVVCPNWDFDVVKQQEQEKIIIRPPS